MIEGTHQYTVTITGVVPAGQDADTFAAAVMSGVAIAAPILGTIKSVVPASKPLLNLS